MEEDRPLGALEPYVLQVSRWDELKDPTGVILGFAEHIAPQTDAHLVYAGPDVSAVADDPEGSGVLERTRGVWQDLPSPIRERVHLALLPMEDNEENGAIVNALQREATVVVQKSLAEGFGLTVAEGMWKRRAVVASAVGGIRDQIDGAGTGVLLEDPRNLAEYGAAVTALLADPVRRGRMGEAAHERIREHFLGTRSLLAYLTLLARVMARQAAPG
jgi:trehalose synthase